MPLSPLGERVACEGAFISRSGSGEGVPAGPLIANNSMGQDSRLPGNLAGPCLPTHSRRVEIVLESSDFAQPGLILRE
jgi:hypothetical protein